MAKTAMIARKRVGKTAPGATFHVAPHEARALHALGIADYAPAVTSEPTKAPSMPPPTITTAERASKREYKRRDMAATQYETKLASDVRQLPTLDKKPASE